MLLRKYNPFFLILKNLKTFNCKDTLINFKRDYIFFGLRINRSNLHDAFL